MWVAFKSGSIPRERVKPGQVIKGLKVIWPLETLHSYRQLEAESQRCGQVYRVVQPTGQNPLIISLHSVFYLRMLLRRGMVFLTFSAPKPPKMRPMLRVAHDIECRLLVERAENLRHSNEWSASVLAHSRLWSKVWDYNFLNAANLRGMAELSITMDDPQVKGRYTCEGWRAKPLRNNILAPILPSLLGFIPPIFLDTETLKGFERKGKFTFLPTFLSNERDSSSSSMS